MAFFIALVVIYCLDQIYLAKGQGSVQFPKGNVPRISYIHNLFFIFQFGELNVAVLELNEVCVYSSKNNVILKETV